jgi:hypothetical protein
LCGGVGTNGGVARVGEWARLPVAEASEVVFVAAEGLVFFVESMVMLVGVWWWSERVVLEFEGAELLIYHLPDYLVGGHGADGCATATIACLRSWMVVMKLFIFWGNFFDARLRKAELCDTEVDNGIKRKLSHMALRSAVDRLSHSLRRSVPPRYQG